MPINCFAINKTKIPTFPYLFIINIYRYPIYLIRDSSKIPSIPLQCMTSIQTMEALFCLISLRAGKLTSRGRRKIPSDYIK